MSENDDNAETFGLDPWIIDGVSDIAIARAESEARRRGLLLVEWLEEAIERALIEEKSGHPLPPSPPDPAA